MRSRTACAIALPVSSSRVKNTAPMIAVTISPMSANCLAKAWLKACSVWVLVSRSEFSEIRSMASATSLARAGSSSCTAYQLTAFFMKMLDSLK